MNEPPAEPMTKWEYRVFRVDVRGWVSSGSFDPADIARNLNELGADGWELVSVFDTSFTTGGSKYLGLIVKRPRRD